MKKTAIACISILCLIFSLKTSGHNLIKGKVINENSQSPLPGASVTLKGASEGTTTDEWGNFSIDTDYESGILIISYIGFQSKEIEFTSHTEFLVITLKPDVIDLNTVQINASTLTPMVTIAQVDVNLRPAKSSQDILRIVPGLFIAQHAGGGKSEQIFFRGFDADHGTDVKITVDGLPVNMVSHAHGQGYADLHWVIPELIREVDFAKGPYYAQHGNFNTAGYVEIKTLQMLDKNMIKLEAGQFNTIRTTGLFNLLGEKAKQSGRNAYVAAEYLMTDASFDNPQNFNRLNLFARFNQVVDHNNMFTVTASLFNSKWDQSGQIPESAVDDGTFSRWGSIDPSEGGMTKRYNLSAKSLHQFKRGGVIKNHLFYTKYSFDLYSNFTFYLEDTIHGDQIKQKEERDLFGYNGVYSRSFSIAEDNNIETQFGGGFRYDQVTGSQLLHTMERFKVIDTSNYGDIFETNYNLFGQLTWLKNRWMVNFGVRFDAFKFELVDKTANVFTTDSKYQYRLSPKLNVAYTTNSKLQLYLKLGQGFHSNDARVVTRNDSLSTLPKAYGADLGMTYKPFSRLIFNVALWYLYLEEELVWSGDAGAWEPSGKTDRYGVDFSLRWQILNWLFFDGDLNYCFARFTEEPEGENYVPLAPIFTSTGGLTMNHRSGWSGTLRYRFISDRPADESDEVSAIGYFVSDLAVNYTWRNWTFGITVENLFNSLWNEAQFAGDYRITPVSKAEYGLTFTPGTPFFFRAGISVLF